MNLEREICGSMLYTGRQMSTCSYIIYSYNRIVTNNAGYKIHYMKYFFIIFLKNPHVLYKIAFPNRGPPPQKKKNLNIRIGYRCNTLSRGLTFRNKCISGKY